MSAFAAVLVHLYAWADRPDVGVGVGMNVDAAVVEGSSPGAVVDEDGVSAPAEACSVPAEDPEGGSDGDGWAKADTGSDDEAGTRSVEDDGGAVDRDVVVGGIDGLDFEVSAVVDHRVVGVGGKVAVVVCGTALTLDGVHDVGPLTEDGVAKAAGPLRIVGHHVED